MEMPGANVTKALADELTKQPADKQILLIQTLGRRGDAGALPALFNLARTAGGQVRIAAIRALPEIGSPSAVPVLVDLLWNADREIAEAAKSCLAGFPGSEASSTIAGLLTKGSTEQRLVAMELVSRRRMNEAIPTLRQAATDHDAGIRAAALKRLGELAGLAEMPTLLGLLSKATNPGDVAAVEEALSALCTRVGDSEACAKQLIEQLPSAKPAQKGALLRVLVTAGGAKSLEAVRSAVKDSNAEVHAAAVEALNSWTTPEAAPDLLALAKTAGNPADKQLGLRGYLRWAADGDVPPPRRLEMCREAAGLVERTEEKRMLLAALGGINQPQSLSLILPFLDDAAVREEACVAAVTVAEKIAQGRNAAKLSAEQIAGLDKVAQVTTNAELAKRAKAVAGANR
jgi:HEAT repeat protein